MLTAPQFSPAALESVRARIVLAAQRAGREPGSVRLLAVSKQQPAAMVRAAAAAGQAEFGENYVQEGIDKVAALADIPACPGTSSASCRPTRPATSPTHFDWVHTVDRERLATRLDAQRPPHAPPLQVLLQVRLADEPGKGGVEPVELPGLAARVAGLPRLRLRGLMCIPPPAADFEQQRLPFRRLRELLAELNAAGHRLDTLSMGMSDDLEAAVAEGATLVRVGTAIFGRRPG